VALETLTAPTKSPLRRSARILGTFNAGVSFALAFGSAIALTKLAHDSTAADLALPSLVLAARWLLAGLLGEWNTCSSRAAKARWRRNVISHLCIPRNEGERSRGDLSSLGIDTNDATRFDELSRGERLRVALVRALVTNPAIVVADEPTSGLGGEETDQALELLTTTGATLVVATHDQRVIEWCDETCELVGGLLRQLSR
jgi:hypothetical protein